MRKCPCLMLLLMYVDEAFDGDEVWHLLCPVCAAGWVREVACDRVSAERSTLMRGVHLDRLNGQTSE